MRILNAAALLALALTLSACAPRGPLTPGDAYYMMKQAYQEGDAAAVESLLSSRAIGRLRSITGTFATMNDTRLSALSREFRTDREKLKSITVRGFIALQIRGEAGEKNPVLGGIITPRIAESTENESTASIVNEQGITLKLVREGPYWKIDEGFL